MILNLSKKREVYNDNHIKKGYKLLAQLNEIAPLYIQVSEKSRYPLITVEPVNFLEAFVVRASNEVNDVTTFMFYDDDVFDTIRGFCKDWNAMLQENHCL